MKLKNSYFYTLREDAKDEEDNIDVPSDGGR